MNKTLTTIITCSFSLLSVCVTHADTPSSSKISLGAMLHLTGEFAMQGEAFRQGIELATDNINKQGGIYGKRIAIVFEDTQYKPVQSVTAAKRFATRNDILANIISVVTEAKAAAPVLEKANLPSIVLWDSSPELEDSGEYIFGIGPWAPSSGMISAQFALQSLKAKKAAIIYTNTEWSVYVSDYFERTFNQKETDSVKKYALDPAEVDFRSILTRAKNNNPDVIYAPIDGNILAFFKQAKELGIKAPIVTSDILDKELFDEGKDLFEGVYQSQTMEPSFPETVKMKALYIEKYNKEPDFLMLTAWGYDSVNIIAHAIKEAGEDRKKIQEAIYKIHDFKGAGGVINFNSRGSSPRSVKVFKVQNQNLTGPVYE
jgi:branched-chain amino acid transport system substrate-binding protein